MGKKRKRPVKGDRASNKSSQADLATASTCFKNKSSLGRAHAEEHAHPVISLYYPQVVTLRQYLLRQIPLSSRSRRRRIVSIRDDQPPVRISNDGHSGAQLAKLLDTTLVGILTESPPTCNEERRQELAAFTQSQSRSELISTDTGPPCAQAEIVDFVISSLFNRNRFSRQQPRHLLARGFRRASAAHVPCENSTITCSIPGLVAQFPNGNVQILKQAPWTDVLGLLGINGEEILMRLLFDCGIFTAVDQQRGIYFQLSGLPLSTLEPVNKAQQSDLAPKNTFPPVPNESVPAPDIKRKAKSDHVRALAPIVFFRRRILYASPSLDSRGKIQFGMNNRTYNVLNRFPSSKSLAHTVHILKYVFPKQFGLHNIFSSLSCGQDMQSCKDYASREEEIANAEKQRQARSKRIQAGECGSLIKIPKRLQGQTIELGQQLQNRNKHCSYPHLLNYYCPSECIGPWKLSPDPPRGDPKSSASESLITQPRLSWQQSGLGSSKEPLASSDTLVVPVIQKPKLSLTDYATPVSSVSAFCRAVLRNLIPPQFYGTGPNRIRHQNIVLKHVDQFVRMRRFESLSLHEVCKGIKVRWQRPFAFCCV
ncbi:hypothetical protein BO94DRAFT_472976 [Aspergillus sclerotioniger CBS 115572]|uniref:Telomerase reverse transcriptase n=1 Tax=Aspergillus sclerotioniger CBS 115572 TaxID=1450535 RepID=A0A317VV53_9EURO|nr:hypothetical protein BO94DRAFT_472976 [Aspergillus sclerotioniger CBS 115572]PWY77241.1 hypothetical protein BO94DRAFT_472976 [Aspergillus sclerotioniger CBS 115572]